PDDVEIEGVAELGAPGQTIALSCSLQATAGATELEVEASELWSQGACIPRHAIELHVVKVWPQAGLGVYPSPARPVAELLLKDDRVDLRDDYVRRWIRPWRRPQLCYRPPAIRLTGPVRTRVEPGHRKQLWISVRIQPLTPPGQYEGCVLLSADGG